MVKALLKALSQSLRFARDSKDFTSLLPLMAYYQLFQRSAPSLLENCVLASDKDFPTSYRVPVFVTINPILLGSYTLDVDVFFKPI